MGRIRNATTGASAGIGAPEDAPICTPETAPDVSAVDTLTASRRQARSQSLVGAGQTLTPNAGLVVPRPRPIAECTADSPPLPVEAVPGWPACLPDADSQRVSSNGILALATDEPFTITAPVQAQVSVQAAVSELVGEEGVANDRVATLSLKRSTADGRWVEVARTPVMRGRFGDDASQKIGLNVDLQVGTYRLDVEGTPGLERQPGYELDISHRQASLTAVTWNMFFSKEPMDPKDPASALNYTRAMAGPTAKGGYDADVIFFQEVDRGDRGYDDHHVINMIDEGLNRGSAARRWALSWGYDDKNWIGRVRSYLVTTIERDHWMDPTGGSDPASRAEGDREAKGAIRGEHIRGAGGRYLDEPGDHGQVGNHFGLGRVYNYEYYMNVSKARMENGEVVFLANIHLKSGKDYRKLRRRQLRDAVQHLQRLARRDPDYDGRILLAGDFNTYNVSRDEGREVVKLLRDVFGYAVDASMASPFDEDPRRYMKDPTAWRDGKVPKTWDKVPTFVGSDASLAGEERFDAFILLGDGWRQDLITEFHWAAPTEFEIHREGNFVPDSPSSYNHGRPIADSDHLPGRVTLSITP